MQHERYRPADTTPEEISVRLAAAKPAHWRGRGELISLPWTSPLPGPILLIDLWSGYSGAAIALLTLGVKFYVLAADNNPDVVQMADAAIDQMVHVCAVELINAKMVRGIMERRSIHCILVGGGSPCQGNTFLNKKRKGLEDPRSLQPNELIRIRDELRSAFPKTPVLTFLENVASSPKAVKEEYDRLMGVKPVAVNAAKFGWVQRNRLYWAAGPRGEDVAWHHAALPANVTLTWDGDRSTLHYGGKPIPRHVRTRDGFEWYGAKPEEVVKNGGRGAMYPFTREFYHPDEPTTATQETVRRWKQDEKRFPVDAYSEGNLLWRGREWRTLTSSERAQVHGAPPAAVRPDNMRNMTEKEAEKLANCAVGNGFHIPSLMVIFMLLLQSAVACPAPSMKMNRAQQETDLVNRIRDTVFQNDVLRSTPGLLTAHQCVDQMELIFKELPDGPTSGTLPWRTVRARLGEEEEGLLSLQRFWAHETRHGRAGAAMGPRPLSAQERAQAWAYLGMQRAAGNSRRGLDHLLRPGLGREGHMKQALALPSPYRPGTTTDPDLRYAAYTMATWGPHIEQWREQQAVLFTQLVEAVRPLTNALRRRMPPTVSRVAAKKDPATIALITVLLRWPDRRLAMEYVTGHRIVGHIESSGIFRAQDGREISKEELHDGFMGQEAINFIDAMMSRQPRRDAADIERLMAAETKKGYQGEPVAKAEMDRRYGPGGWRPMPLFINEESGGKQRLIANAKGGGHNSWTSEEETLFVIAVGFAADATHMTMEECIKLHLPHGATEWPTSEILAALPEWTECGLGCDDMTDAFRQSPVAPEHQGINVVAFFSPNKNTWLFAEVYGLVYGMKSSVLHFNRFPALIAATARRVGGSATGSYVDDFTTVDFLVARGSGQRFTNTVLNKTGGELGPDKHKPVRSQQVMLGVNVRMNTIPEDGTILFEPREETVHKIVEQARALMEKASCTPAEAAKLRGVASWAAGNTFGRAARLGLRALKSRQYQKENTAVLDEQLEMGLRFLIETLPVLGPRSARIMGPTPQPTVIYSDASWPQFMTPEEAVMKGEPPRLGWVVFTPEGRPQGFSLELGLEFMAVLFPRKTQILAAEAVAVLTALVLSPELLAGREIVWFVDNEAALSSLVRGTSRAEDVGHIAACTQLAMMEHSCSAWYEWIDSASNPSDGLSRDGVLDEWTIEQGWDLIEIPPTAFQKVAEYLCHEKIVRITGMAPAGPILPSVADESGNSTS